jgi:hypothetical protein
MNNKNLPILLFPTRIPSSLRFFQADSSRITIVLVGILKLIRKSTQQLIQIVSSLIGTDRGAGKKLNPDFWKSTPAPLLFILIGWISLSFFFSPNHGVNLLMHILRQVIVTASILACGT